MTKYKLKRGDESIEFSALTGEKSVAEFKQLNPEWENVEVITYEEMPEEVKPIVPQIVARWQFKQACSETQSPIQGFENLEQLVNYLISQMPDSIAKQRANRAWTDANNIERTSPTIEALRQNINLIAESEVITSQEIDDVFIKAEQIDA